MGDTGLRPGQSGSLTVQLSCWQVTDRARDLALPGPQLLHLTVSGKFGPSEAHTHLPSWSYLVILSTGVTDEWPGDFSEQDH